MNIKGVNFSLFLKFKVKYSDFFGTAERFNETSIEEFKSKYNDLSGRFNAFNIKITFRRSARRV